MNTFRAILVGLASLIFIAAVTGFAYLLTLQTTVMDRTVAKKWLSESSLYDGRLIAALVQTTNADGAQNGTPQAAANTLSASPEAIKTALNATFTSEFTQTQIEGVVNDAYDWIDGSSSEFAFSIPIDQKRDMFIAQLSKEISPQIAALPACRTAQIGQTSTCRPSNITVEQLAVQLTTQSIDESGMFAEPITNESFSSNNQNTGRQSEQTTLSQLPAARKNVDLLVFALPLSAIISLGVIVIATTRGHRLARVGRLSRRIFLGMMFVFIPTIIIVWLAKDNDLGLSSLFTAQMGQLAIPLIKTIAIGILGQLVLITGVIGGAFAATWIAFGIVQRSKPPLEPAVLPIYQTSQIPLSPAQAPTQLPIDTDQPPTNYQM